MKQTLESILNELRAIHLILERAYPLPVVYPEAGEHLERPDSDETIMHKYNHSCAVCGQPYIVQGHFNTRHLKIVTLEHTDGQLKAGDRVPLCPACRRLAGVE